MKTTLSILLIMLALYAGIGRHPGVRAEQKREVTPVSKVDRVMVYHDRALVTRVAPCGDLEAGAYEILFNNMPSLLLDDSVRAKSTRGDVKILDVEVRTSHLEQSPDSNVLKAQQHLQELEYRRKTVDNRIAVLKRAAEYLDGVSESFLGVPSRAATGVKARALGLQYKTRLQVEDYDRMLSYLQKKQMENATALQSEENALNALDKKIALAREKLTKMQGAFNTLTRKKFIKVTVEVQQRGPVIMEVSYLNRNISWNPGYDIRVFTEEKRTDFTGYGVVAQSSGESWENAKISFSTAQPAVRGYLPELIPVYATLSSKMPQGSSRKGRDRYASQQQLNKAILDNIDGMGGASGKRGDEAISDTSPERGAERKVGSLVFHVPKRADIPSDGSPHRTPISRHALPVKFEFLCIPKLNTHAFLQAVGSNTLDTPILRGDLNIFMGNDFVGSSFTDNILPGQNFELILSVNENIRVTRSLEEKEEIEPGFLGNTKKINYRFLIKIENYSGGEITMNIFDQLPVSRTSEIEIRNVEFSRAPQVRDKKGICKWQFPMKSKETVNLNFSFTVTVPKGQEAAFFRTHLAPSTYLEQLSRGAAEEYDVDEYQKQEKAPALRMKKY